LEFDLINPFIKHFSFIFIVQRNNQILKKRKKKVGNGEMSFLE
jgi:hypothetical protein